MVSFNEPFITKTTMLRTLPAVGHPIRLREIFQAFLGNSNQRTFLKKWTSDSQFFLVSSGSAALTLSLRSLSHDSKRAEVLLPAYTCPSLIASVIKAGLEPVLCDLKPYSFQMDLNHLASKIGPNTLAVIAVHLFGIPDDILALKELTQKKGIILIEDAAQAFGNRLTSDSSPLNPRSSVLTAHQYLGLFGDLSILSFGRGKPLSLLSSGAVIVNNSELYESLNKVYQSLQNMNPLLFLPQYFLSLFLYSIFYHPRMHWFPKCLPWLRIGETFFTLDFEITKIGQKVITLGNSLFEKFREIRKIRLDLTKLYKERLSQFQEEFEFFPEYDGNDIALLRFPIIFKRIEKRDKILAYLKDKGLGATGSFPVPLNELEGVPPYLKGNASYPNAKFISERILTLPLHSHVKMKHIDQICQIIKKHFP